MNIIRVLVVKLRQSHTSDLEQARKAVRAAVVLLPLLGITNLLNMSEAPLEKSALQFALWSYTTHFLTSFQGFFIAMLYCFLNGEVRTAMVKSLSVYLSLRGYEWRQRRHSMYSAAYATAPDTDANYNNAERWVWRAREVVWEFLLIILLEQLIFPQDNLSQSDAADQQHESLEVSALLPAREEGGGGGNAGDRGAH